MRQVGQQRVPVPPQAQDVRHCQRDEEEGGSRSEERTEDLVGRGRPHGSINDAMATPDVPSTTPSHPGCQVSITPRAGATGADMFVSLEYDVRPR